MSVLIIFISFFICRFGLRYIGLDEIPEIDTPGPYILLYSIGFVIAKIILMNFDIVATSLLHCSAAENDG